jgi:S1 RNA binding domain
MKVTLTQSQNGRLLKGWILIRIETNDICTQIWSSVVFDPYEELYVWLGQIRDAQFPTRMIIDEEGRGVEFIVEQVSENLISFCIEPWLCNDQTTRLKTVLESQEFIQVFHNGIMEFIASEYQPIEWSKGIDDLSNQPWGTLIKQSNSSNSLWKKRLALYGGCRGKVSETGRTTVLHDLSQEQQLLVTLRDVLLKTVRLATSSYATEAYALVSLYKNLPIDLVLGELDPIWYEERRVTLEKTHELSQGIRYWKSTQRQRLFAEARLKTLKIGQLIDGRVNKIKSYGLFVDIGGCSALLHIDNISQNSVENLEKFFQAGDWIRAMIIGVDVERGRVSLSTKDLETEAGDMLKDLLLVYTNAKPRS